MTFGERLVELRKSKKYTRESLAEQLGISKYTLRNYELSVNEPGSSFLKQVSDFFDVSIDYLMGMTDEKEKIRPYNLKASEYEHIKKYRLISEKDVDGKALVDSTMDYICNKIKQIETQAQSLANQSDQVVALEKANTVRRMITYYHHMASAGNGEYLFDDIPTELISVPNSSIARQADFVLGVNGDSMEPTFRNGDNVFVEKTDIVKIGEIGIFFIGNECFIKEAGVEGLISHNSKYPIIPGNDSIRCVGRVLGKAEKL